MKGNTKIIKENWTRGIINNCVVFLKPVTSQYAIEIGHFLGRHQEVVVAYWTLVTYISMVESNVANTMDWYTQYGIYVFFWQQLSLVRFTDYYCKSTNRFLKKLLYPINSLI